MFGDGPSALPPNLGAAGATNSYASALLSAIMDIMTGSAVFVLGH